MENVEGLKEIILVVAEGEQEYMTKHFTRVGFDCSCSDSIWVEKSVKTLAACGLQAVSENTNIVLVHDGARPLASTELFNNVADGLAIPWSGYG